MNPDRSNLATLRSLEDFLARQAQPSPARDGATDLVAAELTEHIIRFGYGRPPA
jgi:hypothetical protein